VFIEAFAGEFAGDVRARGLIIGASQFGEVDYVNELIDLVRELNLEEQISFLGHVDDVAHQLERSDILVHCSVLPEPFGAVVIEGLAVGLAVVASDAGGPAEVITSGRDGLLFPPGDVNSLRVALRRLFNDPTYRSALGEEAVKTARRYTYATLAPTSVSWLESVATGQARPGLTDLVSEA
jgi:glycosyltransferase involved in cell wall biosynthesis